MNVARLTDAEKAAFKKTTKEVYDKWAKQIGPELVKKAEGVHRKTITGPCKSRHKVPPIPSFLCEGG